MRSERLKTHLVWILSVVIILPLVLFFSSGGGGGSTGNAAGVVFGHRIPMETYRQEYQLVRRNLESRLGGELPATIEPMAREQAWDRVILAEEARRKIKISDEELARHIHTQAAFQQDGRFVPDLYFRYVRALGYSPQMFEEFLRTDLQIQRLLDTVKQQVALSDDELKAAYRHDHSKLKAALIVLDPKSLTDQIRRTLTPEDLQRYYASHSERFAVPARRTIEYLGWPIEEARSAQPAATDAEIAAYYADHPEEFKDADGKAKPLEEIKDLVRLRVQDEKARKQLTSLSLDFEEDTDRGMRLEEIAASRKRPVRRLGPIEVDGNASPGEPSAAMIRAAFEVPVGQKTKVFNGPEGVFLLSPVEETPRRIPPFEEVRGGVEQQLMDERSQEAAMNRARQWHDELQALRQGGLSFDKASAALGITPKRPEPFDRDTLIPDVGYAPDLVTTLIDLPKDTLSGVGQAPQGAVIGLVEEVLPPDDAAYAHDREAFRTVQLQRKQDEHLQSWILALRQQAQLKSFVGEPAP